MSGALDRLRDALKAHGCEPNEKDGKGTANCPACGDKGHHLSYGQGDAGLVEQPQDEAV